MSSFEAHPKPRDDRAPLRGRGRPAGADGERTRRLLLAGALEAFAERGYEGVSVRRLARELGVSHNLIHHYYGSKRALWEAAVDLGFAPAGRDLFAWIEGNSRRPDWEDAVRQSMREAVLWLARHPAAAAILCDEAARGGPRFAFLFERYVQPFAEVLSRLLATRRTGPAVDSRAALLVLFSGTTALFALRGLASRLQVPGCDGDDGVTGYADTLAELTLHGLRVRGCGGRTAAGPRKRARTRRRGGER